MEITVKYKILLFKIQIFKNQKFKIQIFKNQNSKLQCKRIGFISVFN